MEDTSIGGKNSQQDPTSEVKHFEMTSADVVQTSKFWVEELFQPAFGFKIDDLYTSTTTKKENSTFDQFASEIRPIDTEAIKNVYERVWLMAALEQEVLERKRSESLNKTMSQCTQTHPQELQSRKDDCIWTPAEIAVLREIFHAAQQENRALKVEIHEVEEKICAVQSKNKKLHQTLEENYKDHVKAVMANKRLHILADNLHKQLSIANASIQMLTDKLQYVQTEKQQLQSNLHTVKKQFQTESLERQSLQLKFDEMKKQFACKMNLKEEELDLKYKSTINDYAIEVRELKELLEKEKSEHRRTKLGLDQLRSHFASLPYSGEITNVVTDNQLTKLSY